MRKIMYFTADWCRPCKKFGPALKREAAARDIEVETIDVDKDTEGTALAYGVMSLPTVLVFWRENEQHRWNLVERFGALSTSAIAQRLDR